jgi:hypothetical protein
MRRGLIFFLLIFAIVPVFFACDEYFIFEQGNDKQLADAGGYLFQGAFSRVYFRPLLIPGKPCDIWGVKKYSSNRSCHKLAAVARGCFNYPPVSAFVLSLFRFPLIVPKWVPLLFGKLCDSCGVKNSCGGLVINNSAYFSKRVYQSNLWNFGKPCDICNMKYGSGRISCFEKIKDFHFSGIAFGEIALNTESVKAEKRQG